MTQYKQPPRGSRRLLRGVLLLGLLVVLGLQGRQAIYDWIRLRSYHPAAVISAIAAADGMTAHATHIFYVNHPAIESKAAFSQVCPNGSKETAVLGCYIPNQRGVYVLSVTDPRLQGIEQVTAAHEMLHAAYDRLGSKDRKQIDTWLQDYYRNRLRDPDIKSQIDSYKKSEPNALVNEMHSIFGTEVADLPPNLQQYYARYFADRSKVVHQYASYEAAFTSRQLQVKQYDAELQSLKGQITADEGDLKTKQTALASRQQQLENYRSSGNVSAYNAAIPAYNALVDAYNGEVATVRSLVARYNALVDTRNAIALEEQQLVQDISSNVSPIGSR